MPERRKRPARRRLKTVLTMRQLHPTREQRDGVLGFGAVEYGMQTFDKLAAYLAKSSQ